MSTYQLQRRSPIRSLLWAGLLLLGVMACSGCAFRALARDGDDLIRLCVSAAVRLVGYSFLGAMVCAVLATLAALGSFVMNLPGVERLVRSVGSLFETIGPVLPVAALLVLLPGLTPLGMSVAVGILCWPSLALPLLDELMHEEKKTYVQAAHLMGASRLRIAWVHLWPAVQGRMFGHLFALALNFAGVLSALDFMGFNVAGERSLGALAYESLGTLRSNPSYFVLCLSCLCGVFLVLGMVHAWLRRSEGKRGLRVGA